MPALRVGKSPFAGPPPDPSGCRACCGCAWLLRRARRSGEPPAERARKAALLPFATWVLVISVTAWGLNTVTFSSPEPMKTTGPYWVFVATVLYSAGAATMVFPAACCGELPLRNCEVALVLFGFGTLFIDAYALALERPFQAWPFCVIVLDQLLVIDAHRWTNVCVISAAVAWVTFRCWWTQFGVNNNFERFSLGTVITLAIMAPLLSACIMIFDYMFTRDFAHGMRAREASLAASVAAAERVSESLGKYDTESARRMINGAEGAAIPTRLRNALLRLVANLQEYKPFLPQSVTQTARVRACSTPGSGTTRLSSMFSSSSGGSDGSSGSSATGMDDSQRQHSEQLQIATPLLPPSGDDGPGCLTPTLRAIPKTPLPMDDGGWFGRPIPMEKARGRAHRSSSSDSGQAGSRQSAPSTQTSQDRRGPVRGNRSRGESIMRLEHGVEHRGVALVAANVRGFHALFHDSPGAVCQFHALLVDMFLAAVRPKGTLDSVMGDRGRASFNAVRPCGGYRATAAACAAAASSVRGAGGAATSDLVRHLADSAQPIGVRAVALSTSAGSGPSLVGNAGAEALRTFTVFSTLPGWVHALERVSAQGVAECVLDNATAEQAVDLSLRAVPFLVQHCKHKADVALRLWAVAGTRAREEQQGGGQQEWMYQAQQDTNADPFRPYNDAVEAYLVTGMSSETRQRVHALSCAPMSGLHSNLGRAFVDQLLLLATSDSAVAGRPPRPIKLSDTAALGGGVTGPAGFLPHPQQDASSGNMAQSGAHIDDAVSVRPAQQNVWGEQYLSRVRKEQHEAEGLAAAEREADRLRQQAQLDRELGSRRARMRVDLARSRLQNSASEIKSLATADSTESLRKLQRPVSAACMSTSLQGTPGVASLARVRSNSMGDSRESPRSRNLQGHATPQISLDHPPLRGTTHSAEGFPSSPRDPRQDTAPQTSGMEEDGPPPVIVQLIRRPDEQDRPWGLVLDTWAMVLRGVTPGSIAAQSPQLRRCGGMVVTHVNGIAVAQQADVQKAVADCSVAEMRLCSTARRPLYHALRAAGLEQHAGQLAAEGIRTVADLAHIRDAADLPASIPAGVRAALAVASGRTARAGPVLSSAAPPSAAQQGGSAAADAGADGARPAPFVVRLTRRAFETWIPWGVQVDRSLTLRKCAPGSIAAENELLRAYVGMRLVSVGPPWAPVLAYKDLQDLTADRMEIDFAFRPKTPSAEC